MLTAACIATLLILAVTAGTAWAIGRSSAIKDTAAWKRGYASGHHKGLTQSEAVAVGLEQERDALQAELDNWRNTAQESVNRLCAQVQEITGSTL